MLVLGGGLQQQQRQSLPLTACACRPSPFPCVLRAACLQDVLQEGFAVGVLR